MSFFPLDAGGDIITLRGKIFLGLMIISSLLNVTSRVALLLRLATEGRCSTFTTFSLISTIISFILIIISVIFVNNNYRV